MSQNEPALLLYGPGYAGGLCARELAAQGIPFVLAGRTDGPALAELAAALGAPTRVFALDDPAALARGLAGVRVVLNCAGPFAQTAAPLASACAAHGVHYLDLAGEVAEHDLVAALDDAARASGAMLLPGAGFGVVPTEVAAARAAAALAEPPARLVIAYETVGGASRGTLATVLRGLADPGIELRDGARVAIAPGARRIRMDLGGRAANPGRVGHEKARGALVVTNPWRADLVAAARSTGARSIETYATFPAAARFLMRRPGFLRSRAGRWLIERIVRGASAGPDERALARGSTRVLAVAHGASGRSAEVRVRGPEAYVFTARAAAACARAALDGRARAGYTTPSQLLGLDGLHVIAGVEVSP